jgi:hypothetical protein
MLCTINPDVGGVATDQRSRHFNVMSSLIAILTASAGSTPTNNPVNSSGARDTNYNCVTVIGNTEAGGWTTSSGNYYGPAATFNASQARSYADVYRASGKSSYPWLRAAWTNYTYPYSASGNFNNNPGIRYGCGCTTSDPSTTAFESTEVNFRYTITSPGTGATTNTAIGDWSGETFPNEMLRFDEASETYHVAATANYIVIATPRYFWYFGVRDVAPWETARTDNPPWVHFAYTREQNNGIHYVEHTERVAAWSARISTDATQYAARIFGQYKSKQNNIGCAITGLSAALSGRSQSPGNEFGSYYSIRPLFDTELTSNYGTLIVNTSPSVGYYAMFDTPVADPDSGLTVPPVFPVVFRCHGYSTASASIGKAPGIYKGMFQNNVGYAQYVTAASYTIDGDTYVPVYSGHNLDTARDLWLLRSA